MVIAERDIRSIALPALGCGQGRLDWRDVQPLIESALQDADARVIVYGPAERDRAGSRGVTVIGDLFRWTSAQLRGA